MGHTNISGQWRPYDFALKNQKHMLRSMYLVVIVRLAINVVIYDNEANLASRTFRVVPNMSVIQIDITFPLISAMAWKEDCLIEYTTV